MMSDSLTFFKRIHLEKMRLEHKKRIRKCELRQLFWECTLRCNLNCRHCGSDCKHDASVGDMPLRDFLNVLDDISQTYNPNKILVITTGGEPLMRHDIEECGREITKRGFLWGMVSNAMLLTEQRLKTLIDAGLCTIGISIDGLEGNHNWMRGNLFSFKNAINAIAYLRKANIFWDVITCVNMRNFDELPKLKEKLIDMGVKKWRLITVFPSGRAANDEAMMLSSANLRALMDFIVETRKEGRIGVSFGCESFLGNYECEVRDYTFFCQAGINVASVLSDGSISGCLSIRSDYHQGNIYSDSFCDVWQNKFECYRNRKWKKTGDCEKCAVWRYCEGNGMHLRESEGALTQCLYRRIANLE